MPSFTARTCLGLLTAGALAGGMLAAAPAVATAATPADAAATASHWRVSVISPPTGPASGITAVACPTSTWCSAAGWDGVEAPETGSESNFAVTESHGGWSGTTPFVLPPDAASTAGANVNGIACTGKGSCVAVGVFPTSGTETEPDLIAIEQHGVWQRAFRPSLPRNAGSADSVLYGVTCTGPGSCEAVGLYDENGQSAPMSVTESGGRWRRATGIQLPPHTTPGPYGLSSIACTRAGSCVAVGSYSTTGDVSYVAAAARQVKGHWLRAARLKLPTGNWPVSQLNSVSCQPSGQCVAVGTRATRDGTIQSMMATLSHGHWSNVRPLRRVPPGAPRGSRVILRAVSCARTFCLAAGSYLLRNGTWQWIVIRIRGGTWATAKEIRVPAGNPGVLGLIPNINAASCTRSGACAVVGSFQNESGYTQALAAISG